MVLKLVLCFVGCVVLLLVFYHDKDERDKKDRQ